MSFRVVTPVATEPVTLANTRFHLRVTADPTDVSAGVSDTEITAWISAAREYAEHYTGKAFAPQTLELALDAFPCGAIELPMAPVASVTSVKYTDTAGVEQTVASGDYALSLYGEANRINLAYNKFWPVPQMIADAVRIRYVTGYTTLPKAAYSAIMLLVGYLYENRGAQLAPGAVPGADALLNTIKRWAK